MAAFTARARSDGRGRHQACNSEAGAGAQNRDRPVGRRGANPDRDNVCRAEPRYRPGSSLETIGQGNRGKAEGLANGLRVNFQGLLVGTLWPSLTGPATASSA